MHISIIGTGYVGLVTGACFADMGHTVTCIDIDKDKIDYLQNGHIPIYEPGLQEVVQRNSAEKRLFFTTSYEETIPNADALFFALPTPSKENGECDVSYVLDTAKRVAPLLNGYTVLVMKSTVPVGTGKKVREIVSHVAQGADFDIVSNPEFLKEGSALEDCLKPDRIVIGVETARSQELMQKLYSGFTLNHNRILFMDIASAEITKYAANAMLATRISFMNELSHLCEEVGADITKVRTGIGSDQRIGYDFLYAGPGFGGSCFPKDLRALLHTASVKNVPLDVARATLSANEKQKRSIASKIITHCAQDGGIKGKRITVWGASFKPNTDDIRESPSLEIIQALVEAGATVALYDPVVSEKQLVNEPFFEHISCEADQYAACENADALLLATEWKQFRFPNFSRIKKALRKHVIFDVRNQYDPHELAHLGFTYYSVGRPTPPKQLLETLLKETHAVK